MTSFFYPFMHCLHMSGHISLGRIIFYTVGAFMANSLMHCFYVFLYVRFAVLFPTNSTWDFWPFFSQVFSSHMMFQLECARKCYKADLAGNPFLNLMNSCDMKWKIQKIFVANGTLLLFFAFGFQKFPVMFFKSVLP